MSHKYCVKFKHWTKVKKINKYDFVFAIFVVCFPFALDVILRVSKSLVRNTKKCSKNSKKKKHTSLQNIARFARYLKIYMFFKYVPNLISYFVYYSFERHNLFRAL